MSERLLTILERTADCLLLLFGGFTVGRGINDWIGTGWSDGLTEVVAGLALLSLPWLIRRHYAMGFRAGRFSVYHSMHEASRRGMTWGQWLDAEMEREITNR